MILCAGQGTRLGGYTSNTPKPMLPVAGMPLLEHTIRHLKSLGIKEYIVNLHHHHGKITSYFGKGSRLGVEIAYSYEEKPLGTAGGVKRAEDILKEYGCFFVLYGDVISNKDITCLYRELDDHKCASGAILIHERKSSNSIVEINDTNLITRFVERPTSNEDDKKRTWVNSGMYCFRNSVLEMIPKERFCDFPKDIFPKLVKQEKLYGYPLNEKSYRIAVDSPKRYIQLQKDMKNGLIF